MWDSPLLNEFLGPSWDWAQVDCDCAPFFSAWSAKVRMLYFSFCGGLRCWCSLRCAKPAMPFSLFLHISLSSPIAPSVSICHSPLPIPSWERLSSNMSRVQANECHRSAKKVITPSSPLTPRAQIEPFVVYIKAITLFRGWDRAVGLGCWMKDNCYHSLHLSTRLPGVQWWWPFMSALTLVCLYQSICGAD